MSRVTAVLWLLFLVALAGCGSESGGPSNLPPRHAVSGTVKFNGNPLANATVTFSPEKADGRGAFGQTDEQGRYTLTTSEPDDGAVAGRYKVGFAKYQAPTTPATNDTADTYVPPGVAAPSGPRPKAYLPERYASPATSGVSAEVKEGGNTIDFDLKL